MGLLGDMKASLLIQVDSARAMADLKAFGVTSSQVFGKLEADLLVAEKASERFAKTRAAMQQLGLGLIAVGAAGVIAAKGMLDMAGRMQQAEISFTTMLKSASAGKKMVADLAQFAATTPFEFMGLQETAKKMLAFGFDAKTLIPTLRTLGDAASALGAGSEGMDRMIRAMGQMKSKGRAQAEELLQLAEAGIPVYQILQEELKMTGAEVAKIGEKGVKAQVVIDALMVGLDKRFGGGMQAQAGTWQQVLSNSIDSFSMAMADLGQGLLPTAQVLAKGFTGVLESVRALNPEVKGFLGLLTGVGGAGALAVGGLVLAVNALAGAWQFMKAQAVAAWALMTNPVTMAVTAIGAAVTAISLLVGSERAAELAANDYAAAMKAGMDGTVEGAKKAQDALKGVRDEMSRLAAADEMDAKLREQGIEDGPAKRVGKGIWGSISRTVKAIGHGVGKHIGLGPDTDEAQARTQVNIELTNDLIKQQIGLTSELEAAQYQYAAGTASRSDAELKYLTASLELLELNYKAAQLAGDTDAAEQWHAAWQQTNALRDEAKKSFDDLTKAEKDNKEATDAATVAAEKQADAWGKVVDAADALAEAVKDGMAQIDDAYRALGDATQAYAKANKQYVQDVAKAWETYDKAITDAEERATKTVEDAKDAFVSAFEKREAAVQSLRDAYAKFNEDILGIEARWQDKSQSAWERYNNAVEAERRKTLPKSIVAQLEASDRQQSMQKLYAEAMGADAELASAQAIRRKYGIPDAEKLTEAQKAEAAGLAGIAKAQKALSGTDVLGRPNGAEADLEKARQALAEAPGKAAAQLAEDRATAEENLNNALDAASERLDAAYQRRVEAEYKLADVVDNVRERWEKAVAKANAAETDWNKAYPNQQVPLSSQALPSTTAGTRPDMYGGGTGPSGQPIIIQIGGNVYGDQALQQALVEAFRQAGVGA